MPNEENHYVKTTYGVVLEVVKETYGQNLMEPKLIPNDQCLFNL